MTPLPPIKQPLEPGYYWIKETKDQKDWEIAEYTTDEEWYTVGQKQHWTATPVFIGPKIPHYTGAE